MSKVISISNHKGGVGKTTSAINIGAGLNKLGKKILLIDLDPQANLSQSLGLIDQERNIYGALRGEYKLQPIEIVKGLDMIPSTLDLSGAEVEMSGEAGDIERIANLIIGFWNNNFKPLATEGEINEINLKGCFTPDTIYTTVLKNRGGRVGLEEILSFNGNTGKIKNSSSSGSSYLK